MNEIHRFIIRKFESQLILILSAYFSPHPSCRNICHLYVIHRLTFKHYYYNCIDILFQAHLLSVFDNTKTVTFDEKQYDKIIEINSQEGESIALEESILAQVSSH